MLKIWNWTFQSTCTFVSVNNILLMCEYWLRTWAMVNGYFVFWVFATPLEQASNKTALKSFILSKYNSGNITFWSMLFSFNKSILCELNILRPWLDCTAEMTHTYTCSSICHPVETNSHQVEEYVSNLGPFSLVPKV